MLTIDHPTNPPLTIAFMLNIYKASAGSGKTYTLVYKYIYLLLSHRLSNAHRRILAVTFTHKATKEMKSRVLKQLFDLGNGSKSDYREGLSRELGISPEMIDKRAKKVLIDILQDFSKFSINTIDSFFLQIVRAFVRELNLSGTYNIELDNKELLTQAIDNMFFELGEKENIDLFKWLTAFTRENIADSKHWNPRYQINALGEEIFKEDYQAKLKETSEKLHDKTFLANYKQTLSVIVQNFEQDLLRLGMSGRSAVVASGLEYKDFSYGDVKYFEKLINKEPTLPSARLRSFMDTPERSCPKKSTNPDVVVRVFSQQLIPLLQEAIDLLENKSSHYNSARIILRRINTLGILSDISTYISKLARDENIMPLSETNMLINKIIADSDAPFIYEKTGTGIDHFMIDEFQDTSSLQWKNFEPLIRNSISQGNENLLVGDVKQSIYRWRNSDWRLLGETVPNDATLQTKTETLDTNWRSNSSVVQFNNNFFVQAAALMTEKVKATSPLWAEQAEAIISNAYSDVKQHCSKSDTEGYVQIHFFHNEEDDQWEQQALERLVAEIGQLQERNVALHEIAVLARGTKQIQHITQHLIEQGIPVVSNEGLLISTSPCVRFILGLLRLFINHKDHIQRTIVNFEYARFALHHPESIAIALSQTTPHFLFDPAQQVALERISHLSLYDVVDQVVNLFQLHVWSGQYVFLQAFMDEVFAYATNRRPDMHNFLQWWDQKSEKITIPMPEVENAVQLMTIHKSKGLEFKAVIVPFCSWKIERGGGFNPDILWCTPSQAPFDALPLLPVAYSSKLQDSIFAKQYQEERLNIHIDNLNLLYVAFTRAEAELYCYAPLPKAQGETLLTIADLLYQCTQHTTSIGQQSIYPPREPDQRSTSNMEEIAAVRSLQKPLQRQLVSQKKQYNSQQSLGTTMHKLLGEMRLRSDQDRAIATLLDAGEIRHEELPRIHAEFEKFWSIQGVEEWFSPQCKVMTEAAIISSQSKIFRPDRVIIRPDQSVVVVDYKFGAAEHHSHHAQLNNYKALIAEMGYRVDAYLCYIEIGKIVRIEEELLL